MEKIKPPYGDLDFNPHSIPAEYREAIGFVTVSWASLEQAIASAITELAGLDVRSGAIMVTHSNFPQKTSQLKALVNELLPPNSELYAVFKLLMAEVEDCERQRNNIVHCSWCVFVDTKRVAFSKVRARGQLIGEMFAISAEELTAVGSKIHETCLNVHRFFFMPPLLSLVSRQPAP